jgi:CheY-like chemotaxis protein
MLAVSDTGCGMDAATQARLFEPFFTTKEKGKGTGLGLSMVYGIVKQSGGNLHVYSELGKGSVFRIYLPQAEGSTRPAKSSATRVAVLGGDETVLVVEDEEQMQELVQSILEKHGYKVLSARHGKEALLVNEGHQGPIHLLLTDVLMPEMGGPELAERLMALRPGLKVIFMSGYTDNAAMIGQLLRQGFQYIEKPFTSRDLAKKVRVVLDRKKAEAEQS